MQQFPIYVPDYEEFWTLYSSPNGSDRSCEKSYFRTGKKVPTEPVWQSNSGQLGSLLPPGFSKIRLFLRIAHLVGVVFPSTS